jgi:hypothetical protein
VDLWGRLSNPPETLEIAPGETVIHHLDRQAVSRHRVVSKMNDSLVAQASKRYGEGLSLVDVAADYGVHERTLAREFRMPGFPSDPGWVGAGEASLGSSLSLTTTTVNPVRLS